MCCGKCEMRALIVVLAAAHQSGGRKLVFGMAIVVKMDVQSMPWVQQCRIHFVDHPHVDHPLSVLR